MTISVNTEKALDNTFLWLKKEKNQQMNSGSLDQLKKPQLTYIWYENFKAFYPQVEDKNGHSHASI